MKSKGSRAERELIHMLWDTGTWAAMRSAGSGSTPLPSPDIIASNGKKILAIECKSIQDYKKYFDAEEIGQLVHFSNTFGAQAWVAVKFNHKGWFFFRVENLGMSSNGTACVDLELAQKEGKTFEELIQ
jgi:Holliday junction resolvase